MHLLDRDRVVLLVYVGVWLATASSCGVLFKSESEPERQPTASEQAVGDEAEPADAQASSRDDDTRSSEGASGEGASDRLMIDDLAEGEGTIVTSSSWVTVRLRGTLEDGSVVHESDEPEGPWPVDHLIPGLAKGLEGMAVGGERRIIIPPELGYADEPVVDDKTGETLIPAGSTLVYEVELLEAREGEPDASASPDDVGEGEQ